MSSQIPDTPPTAAHAKADTTSLGDLLGEVTRDLSTLIRQEIELAKAELKQSENFEQDMKEKTADYVGRFNDERNKYAANNPFTTK